MAGSTPAKTLALLDPNGKVLKSGTYSELGPQFVALGGKAAGYTMGEPPTVTAVTWQPDLVSKGFFALTVDADKAEKIAETAKKIEAAGFALPKAWFAPGTRMMQIGVDKYKREYLEWASRPDAVDALMETAEHIRSEDRRSFTVALSDLRMQENGLIGRKGSVARRIEWGAWEQIFRAASGAGAFPDGRRLMKMLSPKMRAEIFNDRIKHISKDVKIGVRKDRETGEWTIFRVVGKNFPEDGNGADACEAAAKALRGLNFRGHVEYNPNTTDLRFDAAHMADPVILDPTVGDIFRGGIKGKTNDAGGGSFVVNPFVGRIICINCTIADAYAPGVRKAHRGSMESAITGIHDAAKLAAKVVPLFAEDWSYCRDTYIEDVDWHDNLGRLSLDTRSLLISDPSAQNVIRALVESKKIDAKIGRDALVSAMLASFREEPGDTVADVINAITKTAHSKVPVMVGEVIEKQAGKLLAAIPAW